MSETVAAVASAIIAWVVPLVGLIHWYLRRRSAQLRLNEVSVWAERCIAALQTTYLCCALDEDRCEPKVISEKIDALIFELSILVEQGRLFFRNVPHLGFGAEKEEAYQGLRPRILDQLVIAQKVACAWRTDHADRRRMALVAEDAERKFVSLIRHEVGRDIAATTGAAEAGIGVRLPDLIRLKTASHINGHHWP